ncbi:MAG: SUF system NifU family Fe-S cluster assembly protein [Anaerolineae bacterium]
MDPLGMYQENILDHYQNPRNHGTLDEPVTIRREEYNPLCGDRLTFELRIVDDKVEAVRFRGHGCAISQAAASMLSEELIGKTVDEVKALQKQDVLDLLGIPISPTRLKCALLSLKAVKAGVYGVPQLDIDEDDE